MANDNSRGEYIDRVEGKSLYDPVLTAQMANGFAVKGLILSVADRPDAGALHEPTPFR